MAVTPEQWAAAAADDNLTVDELRAQIADIDRRDAPEVAVAEALQLPHTMFDREGDPLTLGEWAMLFGSRSYRFMRETILPNRVWIATIWQGVHDTGGDTPLVMETGVFVLGPDNEELPPPLATFDHSNEQEAFVVHEALVRQYSSPVT